MQIVNRTLWFFFILSFLLGSCQRKYPIESIVFDYQFSEVKVIKGRQLTLSVCGPCHFNSSHQSFSGKQMMDVPKVVGTIFASNITNDTISGIGNYTPGQIRYLLKTGISKDGKFLPYMLKPNLADEDIENIVAYPKSTDPFISPNDNNPGKTKYTLLGKLAIGKVFQPLAYSKAVIKRPSNSDTVALGKYLVDITGCFDCHSASVVKINKAVPEMSKGYLGGGAKLRRGDGKFIRSPNLTSDPDGIGSWTAEEFEQALIIRINPQRKPITYPMPEYSSLSTLEMQAIYSYLKTVPLIKDKRKKGKVSSVSNNDIGKSIYEKYSCSSCHGTNGNGVTDLTRAYAKYSYNEIVEKIKKPLAGSGMPVYDGVIFTEEYPELVKYIVQLGEKYGQSRQD